VKASQWILGQMLEAIPRPAPTSIVQWAEDHVKLIGSARSESYRANITPWTVEPIECGNDGTRRCTFIKPIQAGGSSVGEIVLMFWLSHWLGGDIQYNWPSDVQADERWKKHTEKKLKSCGPVMARTSPDRFAWSKGLVIFPHANFMQQGVLTDRSVTADSVRGQVNEELHDEKGWTPGRLQQALGRCTAFWNSIVFNISNGGRKGSELHKAFTGGTCQHWQVLCPGCGQFHVMRTRWEDSRPELGGLRYDMDGCRMENGDVNYERLRGTIFYQMPCGYKVHDDIRERRALSRSGQYSEPTNKGAPLTERSYHLEAVSVDFVSWLELIQEKHLALRALKFGDAIPWLKYLRERESQFVDPMEDRPMIRSVQFSETKKNRAGLPNRIARFAAVDRQRGSLNAGELPHWWLLIQDIGIEPDGRVHFLVVWEGRCLTDSDTTGTIAEHGVTPLCVAVDSSHDSAAVYQFCLSHGYNAVKVAGREPGTPIARYFKHPDGSERIFSFPKPLWELIGTAPSREDPNLEPEFWHLSLFGALDRLHYIRNSDSIIYEVPKDVSQDFLAHMESWEMENKRIARTNETVPQWVQRRRRDDLLWCACCIAVQAEMGEILGMVAEAKKDAAIETASSQEP
jgi:Phage terminase large subunit (GpA)